MKTTSLVQPTFVTSTETQMDTRSTRGSGRKGGRLRRALLGSIAAVAFSIGVAHAGEGDNHPIARRGFTLALHIGPGGDALFPPVGGSSLEPGVGAGIALGAFLAPNLALLGRVSGVGYFTKTNVDAAVVGVVGPALEWWLSDHLNVLTGIGVGFTNIKPQTGDEISKSGFGLMLGGHWFPWASSHHGLGLYAEIQPVFLANGGGQAFTFQSGFAWQYY